MTRFLLIFALAGSLWGQSVTTATGSGHVTGIAQSGGKVIFPLPGPPTQYAARTDTCAVGTETGCTGGRAVTLNFQMRSTDAPPFAATNITSFSGPCTLSAGAANTGVTDPDFLSHLIMVTDPCSRNTTTLWYMAELNDGTDVFAYDSSMFFVPFNGGGPIFKYLNATAIRTHTCAPTDTTLCLAPSQIIGGTYVHGSCSTGCTVVDNGGLQSFSRVAGQANILYELESDGLHVNRLAICRKGYTDTVCASTASDTFTRTTYANFSDPTYGIIPAGYISSWTGTFGISDDGSIAIAEGGGPDWTASTAYYALGSDTNTTPTSFIFPQTNNGATPKDAFQSVTTGYSGASEPTWTNTAEPILTGCCTITPGTYICEGSGTTSSSPQSCPSTCGSGAQQCAQEQNIGTIKGQGPGFDVFNYVPPTALALGAPSAGYTRLNSRIDRVYRGQCEGTTYPTCGTQDPSGSLTTDDGVVCLQYGGTLSGNACSTPEPFTETNTIHGAESLENSAYISVTWTGGGSAPPAFNYSPTTIVSMSLPTNTNYRGAWNGSTTYANHDAVYDPNNPANLYVSLVNSNTAALSNATNWAANFTNAGPISSYKGIWQRNSLLIRPCLLRGVSGSVDEGRCPGHESHGYLNFYGDVFYTSHAWGRPTIPASGAGAPGAIANPNVALLTTPIPGDDHGTYRNAGLLDLTPMGDARTSVPTQTYAAVNTANPGISAGYGEFVGIRTDGSQVFYRFAHTFNDGIENDFSTQNNIGSISQDGNWALFGTDVMGTRGSRSGGWVATTSTPIGTPIFPTVNNTGNFDYVATAIGGSTAAGGIGTTGSGQPNWDSSCTTTCTDGTSGTQITWTRQAGACNQARQTGARYQPASGITMAQGDLMYPVTNNGSGNIFQAQAAVPGTTSGSAPNWGTTCGNYNQTCSYGPVVLTNIGPSDCRADVVLVDLVSAH